MGPPGYIAQEISTGVMPHLALPAVQYHLPDMVVTRVVQEALAHSLVMWKGANFGNLH